MSTIGLVQSLVLQLMRYVLVSLSKMFLHDCGLHRTPFPADAN
jgi:hypothetical protein